MVTGLTLMLSHPKICILNQQNYKISRSLIRMRDLKRIRYTLTCACSLLYSNIYERIVLFNFDAVGLKSISLLTESCRLGHRVDVGLREGRT